MKAVKTNELKVGDWAAHMVDLPNCKGIEVKDQGEIVDVKHCDMWGVPSETHTSVELRPKGADEWTVRYMTVHNSHTWLVRARRA